MLSETPAPDGAPTAPTAPTAAVVLLGGGRGTRVGAEVNKVLLPLRGVPVIGWSLRAVLATDAVGLVVIVCRPVDREAMAEALAPLLGDREALLVDGGATRHQSEAAALRVLAPYVASQRVDVVALHDGARPLATPDLFARTIELARAHGGALPTLALPGLLPREPGGPDVGGLVGVQTPQAFRAVPLLEAYDRAAQDGFEGTDTAACWERYVAEPLAAVPSGPANLKVTYPEDLPVADRLAP